MQTWCFDGDRFTLPKLQPIVLRLVQFSAVEFVFI